MKRILFLKDIISTPSNGAEINFYRLYKALHQKGYPVDYLCLDPFEGPQFYVNYFQKAGYQINSNQNGQLLYTIHGVPITVDYRVKFNRLNLADSKSINAHILNLLKSINPDIIFCYQTDYIALEAALEFDKPVVSFLTDNEFPRKEALETHPHGEKITGLIKATKCYSSLSHFLRASFQKHWGIDSKVLYGLISREEYEVPPAGFCGINGMVNTAAHKGFPLFSLLAMAYPQDQFAVLINSLPQKSQSEAYQILLREIPNFRIMGPLLDPRVFYSQLRQLFVPSLWHEAFGRVVVEAALSGIPVLASNRGGLPEALNGGGILLPPPFVDPTGEIPVREVVSKNQGWFDAYEQLRNETYYKQVSAQTKTAAHEMLIKIQHSFETFVDFIESI